MRIQIILEAGSCVFGLSHTIYQAWRPMNTPGRLNNVEKERKTNKKKDETRDRLVCEVFKKFRVWHWNNVVRAGIMPAGSFDLCSKCQNSYGALSYHNEHIRINICAVLFDIFDVCRFCELFNIFFKGLKESKKKTSEIYEIEPNYRYICCAWKNNAKISNQRYHQISMI